VASYLEATLIDIPHTFNLYMKCRASYIICSLHSWQNPQVVASLAGSWGLSTICRKWQCHRPI